MAHETSQRARRLVRILSALVLAVIVVVAVGAAGWFFMGWESGFSAQAIEETILAWGMWGVAASMALMIIHSFVPFPSEFIAFANGMVYGPVWGTIITWGGAMLGAFLAFALSRLLGRPFVESVVSEKNWHLLDEWTARHGVHVIFLSRFVPVISFNLINYAAGLMKISWWTFTWTTGLGILPMTILMVMMGDHSEDLSWRAWLLLLGIGIALWLALRRWLRPSQLGFDRGV
jgi:uncharacterized membrane protein YdjX (TVP38/TMEM64 family)